MNLPQFVLRSALRNKRRTLLTTLSTGFSLFLLLAFKTFLDYLTSPPPAKEGELRLNVAPATSMMESLPISYLREIDKVPHVRGVSPFQLFPCKWRDDARNFTPSMGVMPDRFTAIFPDIHMAPEVREKFLTLRTGAIVGHELAKATGWKAGDRITLKGMMLPVSLELDVLGEFQWSFRSNMVFFNYKYLDEVLDNRGRTTMFWVMADSAEAVPQIKEQLEQLFVNSPSPAIVYPERLFAMNMLSRIGNVKLLMQAIAAVVTFTMLLVSGGNMAMALRERGREIGILKSLGFSRPIVLGLLLAEAAFLSILSAIAAAIIATGMQLVPFQKMTDGMLQSFYIRPVPMALTAAAGLGIGLLAALPSALRASGMTIAVAIRRLE
ncbi:ABC transporter permease [Candidatus Sumerlaeota bacterium]|nr:ABC transporter permease [Candidatus Sumerlaeota bacterium]